ncbi:MAG: thioredoxin-like domain-containing protein, partial [Ferruginibacter sp.]
VKGNILQQERMAYNESKSKEDSLLHQTNFEKANKELIAYRNDIIENQPKSMMALMLKTMYEPDILIKNPKTRQDTIDNYQYFKKHYWDGVTFMDERVIRTPFFIPKFERYYRDVLLQVPDTLIEDIDYRLLFARNNNEVFKFMINWFTDEYISPKIMGHDAIYVHLFEKYHSKGLSPWLNEKQMKTVTDRAYMVMSNLIGAPAPPLDMLSTDGKMRPLLDEKASYILVVFWDPTCGHCKEEIPRIDSIYRASWKRRGVKIYSVLSDNTKEIEWRKYLIEHNLKDWINVYETKAMEDQVNLEKRPGFRQLYDVIQTPTIMLLDKDKKIIGKKLGITQINELLETRWRKEQ